MESTKIKAMLLGYFKCADRVESLSDCEFKIVYKDRSFLKRVGMTKLFYRTYFLTLQSGNFKQKSRISKKEKDLLKTIIKTIN